MFLTGPVGVACASSCIADAALSHKVDRSFASSACEVKEKDSDKDSSDEDDEASAHGDVKCAHALGGGYTTV